jgi:hypothetical protein
MPSAARGLATRMFAMHCSDRVRTKCEPLHQPLRQPLTVTLYLPMVLLGLDRLPCRYHLRAPSLGWPQLLPLVAQKLRS